MTVTPNVNLDTSKLSEENIKNFNKQDDTADGKKWVSYRKVICDFIVV